MKSRAAVVGVGYLGRFHAQKYKANPDVELVAVCDGRFEQAETVAKELGTAAVRDPKDLIGKVDLVTVAASTQAHYELGKLFLEAGIPLNLEKPLAATVPQARELVDLAKKKNVLLCTGHIERFNPAVLAVKKELRKPRVFDLIRHTGFRNRGADVSVLHDLMIHDVDMMLFLSGANVKNVRAGGSKLITNDWDAVEAFFDLDDGSTARLSASRVSSRPLRMVRVLDEGRTIQADTGTLEVDLVEPVSREAAEPLKITKTTAEKVDALQMETNAFIAAVRGTQKPAVTGADGLKALEIVAEIERQLAGARA